METISLASLDSLTLPAGQSYSLSFCINKVNVVVVVCSIQLGSNCSINIATRKESKILVILLVD